MNRLQRKIKVSLLDAGLTQANLADKMGVSASSLSVSLSTSMNMKRALILSDALKELTNVSLTLEDFR
tara:strand:+ start:750 stop:953 length:204 start_codon:yes stop_codon:yes gene_type:complete